MSRAQAYGVVSSTKFSMAESLHSLNISIEFILKSNEPEIEPCGTPYSIFIVTKTFVYFGAMAAIAKIEKKVKVHVSIILQLVKSDQDNQMLLTSKWLRNYCLS